MWLNKETRASNFTWQGSGWGSALRGTSPAKLRRTKSRAAEDFSHTPNASDKLLEPGGESCNSESFEKMYSELRHRFKAVAYSILGNNEDAEDAVQDALVSGYLNLRNFEGRSGLATWFTRIVINSSLMLLRKRKSAHLRFMSESSEPDKHSWLEQIPEIGPDPEMLCAEEQTSQMIEELLNRASPLLSEAFRLSHFEELSNKEGATKLGIKTATFKARVFRARQYLAEKANYSQVVPLVRPAQMILLPANGSERSDAEVAV